MTLHCGDSLAYLQSLPDNSVDAVVTDPPYFKVKGEAWDRQWETAAVFLAWLDLYLCEFQRLLRPNGSLYLFASPQMAARVECKIAERFNVLNHIVWLKPRNQGKHMANNKESLRSYFPNTERLIFAEHFGSDNYAKGEAGYLRKCDELRGFLFEPLRAYLDGERARAGFSFEDVRKAVGCAGGSGLPSHWFTASQWALPTQRNYERLRAAFNAKGGEYLRREYEDLRREYEDLRREYEDLRREYEDLRRPFAVTKEVPYTDVWEFATVGYYEGKHPCEKPVDLLQHIISTSTRPGSVVLDPFMGSGSTGLAALALGRDFIGCELDDRYFRMASDRLAHAAQCAGSDVLTTHHRPEPAAPKQHAQTLSLFA